MTFLATLTGSFSTPAGDNPTVAMVEAAYRHAGLNARYVNCEVAPQHLSDAVRGAVAMGWVGFNCSLPHKVDVIGMLDELAESASVIGAVNCVIVRDGRLIGENTDGQGFLASARETMDPVGQNVVILGAGGAARAIAVELGLAGARRITIVNRDQKRGAEVVRVVADGTAAEVRLESWDRAFTVPAGTGLLVNATSIGLAPQTGRPSLDYDSLGALGSDLVVADVIPNPPQTAFLATAAERGCRTIDGLGMLVNQGIIGIRLWTGIEADPAVMRSALAEALELS